jgi:uncharacterized surface protein with fasciclin (FAS1) repeats
MKSSLKNIISLIGIAGLSFSVSLPSLAQSSPSPRDPSPTSGSGVVSQPSSGSSSTPMMGNPGQSDRQSATAATPSKSIAEIVDQNPSFEMLNALLRVAALEQPAMISSLSGNGKYTVFAPTNQAFAALPSNAVHALVQPQNRDLLVRLLSYHVVSGTVASNAVPVGTSYPNRNLLSDMVPAGNFSSSSRLTSNPTIRSESDINAPTNENRNAGNENTGRSSMNGSSRMDVQAGANNQAQPPSGDLNPNEPSNTVDRSQVTEPSYSNPDQHGGMSSSNRPATRPSNGSTTSSRPNNNPTIRSESDINAPTNENRNAGNENTGRSSVSSPSGRSSTRVSSGMVSSNGTAVGAMTTMSDIQAKNGVIHPIDRVIIPAALQAELQQAIAADARTASR